ncbi:OmpA family protein [Algoriphagus sp.]|uniref:OmpA family protein n=1 Tax=Algoriphagus sp. TaxID=1872435 RepID=UPI00263947AB|nr:OmpA family protein [Algoriphagus sp.]
MKKLMLSILILIFSNEIQEAFAQSQFIKDLKKTAEEAAKRAVERKVDEKTTETTEKAFDSVMEAPNIFKSKRAQKRENQSQAEPEGYPNDSEREPSKQPDQTVEFSPASQFIPNGELMYEDLFEAEQLGDFPSKWETNTGGEVITIDDFKALRTSGTGFYLPILPEALPENYALEFDMFTYNLHYKGTSALRFAIHLIEEPLVSKSRKGASIEMPLWYDGASDYFQVETYGTSAKISNKINYDFTEKLNDLIHFTLVKNGKRVRLFLDDTKVIDIPTFAVDNFGKYIQFYVREVDLQKDLVLALANLKITKEGEDLRSKLIRAEGFSTTAILFETGSDQLIPDSYSFLDKLGKVLREDESLRVQIIGHTDSDGDEASNLILSDQRAISVATYLTDKYQIKPDRIQTLGKGESEPLNGNSSPEEKSANRRVEFKKF